MKLKTIDIKGKPYVPVNARLKHFRDEYKGYQLTTEILKHDDDSCLIKASLISPDGVLLSTGHAYERTAQGPVNKTSHVENAETSACGRCLGLYGIGIDEEVRSYEEMSWAVEGQKEPKKKVPKESACAETESIKKEALEDLIFKDISTLTELSELWIALTKKQQGDKDIMAWKNIRKQQFEDEKNG